MLKHEFNGVTPNLEMTDNIRLGSVVDNILTEPHKVNMGDQLYPIARDIASKLKSDFGELINQFKKQISYTADVSFNGFNLPVTGRLDFELPKNAVIDLKITKEKNIAALIGFMGYENQLWHYSKMAQVKNAYLMFYSIPLKKTLLFAFDCSSNYNEFWADKIIKFGKINE